MRLAPHLRSASGSNAWASSPEGGPALKRLQRQPPSETRRVRSHLANLPMGPHATHRGRYLPRWSDRPRVGDVGVAAAPGSGWCGVR
jgi:hypothetical protein